MPTVLRAVALALLLQAAAVLPAAALELLMVERDGCVWCARWHRELGAIYPKTDEGRAAPLTRADLASLPAGVRFGGPVVFTPTFVLVDDGREVGRITGYADDAQFWGLLGRLLQSRSGGAG
jgi:hypothetical protein